MNPSRPILRLILVDNQPAGLENFRAALSPALQFVGQAADSQETVQLCRLTNPDAVLVNLAAPGLDGIGVIHWVVRQWPEMAVLALVAAGDEGLLRAALDAGAAGYLPHEAAPQALAATIAHVIEARRSAARPAPLLAPSGPPAAPRPSRRTGELAEAARIQSSLLPGEPPAIPGWELAVRLQPARETSGDFFDFLPLENGKLAILIGDVSDKGLGAALFMAMTSTLFRTFTGRQPSLPALTMSAVNERILSDSGGSSFVTAFLGILEPQTGRLRYVNAGHVPPVLLSALKGKGVDSLGRTGMALGVLPDAAWGQKLVRFAPGDCLLLYTDGILDAQDRHGEFYGEQRLLRAARARLGLSASQIVEALLADVASFTGGLPISDDVILMVVRRRA